MFGFIWDTPESNANSVSVDITPFGITEVYDQRTDFKLLVDVIDENYNIIATLYTGLCWNFLAMPLAEGLAVLAGGEDTLSATLDGSISDLGSEISDPEVMAYKWYANQESIYGWQKYQFNIYKSPKQDWDSSETESGLDQVGIAYRMDLVDYAFGNTVFIRDVFIPGAYSGYALVNPRCMLETATPTSTALQAWFDNFQWGDNTVDRISTTGGSSTKNIAYRYLTGDEAIILFDYRLDDPLEDQVWSESNPDQRILWVTSDIPASYYIQSNYNIYEYNIEAVPSFSIGAWQGTLNISSNIIVKSAGTGTVDVEVIWKNIDTTLHSETFSLTDGQTENLLVDLEDISVEARDMIYVEINTFGDFNEGYIYLDEFSYLTVETAEQNVINFDDKVYFDGIKIQNGAANTHTNSTILFDFNASPSKVYHERVKEIAKNASVDYMGTAPSDDRNQGHLFGGETHLDIGTTWQSDISNKFSVECWIKTTGQYRNEDATVIASETDGLWIKTKDESDDELFLGFSNGTTDYELSLTGCFDNKYHYIVMTHDGSTLRAYKDGELVSSIAASTSISFGASTTNLMGDNWKGHIDDLVIYNKQLGSDRIQSHYLTVRN